MSPDHNHDEPPELAMLMARAMLEQAQIQNMRARAVAVIVTLLAMGVVLLLPAALIIGWVATWEWLQQ